MLSVKLGFEQYILVIPVEIVEIGSNDNFKYIRTLRVKKYI